MRIFITSDLSKSPWKDSSVQASIFLYESIQSTGAEVFMLNAARSEAFTERKNKFYNMSQIDDPNFPSIDVLIICGAKVSLAQQESIKNRFGSKIILYQHYFVSAILQENFAHNKPLPCSEPLVDEIWVPEHHSKSMQYVSLFYNPKASIKSVPYLWDSSFINSENKRDRINFEKEEKKSIVIFEDNKYSFKTCLMPIMICEKANQLNPKAIDAVSAMNTSNAKKNLSFMNFSNDLTLNKQNKLHLSGAWNFSSAVSKIGKYILSYQENNHLNYLFLEALYLGLPLIHNSEYIKEYGYYFNSMDLNWAANQVLNALSNHEENLEVYREQNKFLIKSYHPKNHKNKAFFNSCF